MRMSRKEFKQKYPDASITAWIRYRCNRREPVKDVPCTVVFKNSPVAATVATICATFSGKSMVSTTVTQAVSRCYQGKFDGKRVLGTITSATSWKYCEYEHRADAQKVIDKLSAANQNYVEIKEL